MKCLVNNDVFLKNYFVKGDRMNPNKLASVIILIAVAVVIIWGFTGVAGGWHYSWIAMLVAVVVAGIIKIIGGKEN